MYNMKSNQIFKAKGPRWSLTLPHYVARDASTAETVKMVHTIIK